MELDEDWTENSPFRVMNGDMTLHDDDAEAMISEAVALPLETPPPSRISTLLRRKVPATLLGSFTSVLRPIAIAISLPSSQSSAFQATSTPSDFIRSITASLSTLESTALPASDRRKSLLHAIGAGHTILAFVQDDRNTRRPRTGLVAEELEVLADILAELGILDCVADLYELAENVRQY